MTRGTYAAALAAMVLLFTGCGGADDTVMFQGAAGLTFSYPREFTARRFSTSSFSGSLEGVMVSNFANRASRRLLTGPFPARGVAMGLERSVGGLERTGGIKRDDTRFPLRVGSFEPAARIKLPRNVRWTVLQAGGFPFLVYVRTGLRASARDRAAADAIVESIRFPGLRTGTTAPSGLWVVGRAGDFESTVTRLDSELPPRYRTSAPPLSLYLVRLESGFRAYPTRALLGGGRRLCPVDYDRGSRRFRCSVTGAEWDLEGRLVRGRRGAQTLESFGAPISYDDHVLVPLVQTRLPR